MPAKKGEPRPEPVKKRISEKLTGREKTAEHKANLSRAAAARVLDQKTRDAISAGVKRTNEKKAAEAEKKKADSGKG